MPRLRLAPHRAHPRFRAAVAELLVVRRRYARSGMNDTTSQPTRYSMRLRIVQGLCAAIAVASVFYTGLRAIKSGTGDGPEILAPAAFTLAFAHSALFLSRRVYAPTENSGRSLTFFALVVGYLSVARGLYLLIST